MTGKKYEPPLYIDMEFDEALERYVGTDPKEVAKLGARKKAGRKKRPAPVDDNGERQSGRGRERS